MGWRKARLRDSMRMVRQRSYSPTTKWCPGLRKWKEELEGSGHIFGDPWEVFWLLCLSNYLPHDGFSIKHFWINECNNE